MNAHSILAFMSTEVIQPEEFVAAVTPMLERQDLCGLFNILKTRWSTGQIRELLRTGNTDARKVAALALGLVGGKCCIEALAEQLRDPDPVVNEMAEHALWSIWFRSGNPQANTQLARGARSMDRQEYFHAVEHFSRAILIDPSFAEAYNQRAIAWYLVEQYEQSIEDCKRVVKLMPCHFGAWAGMGHAYAHQGLRAQALKSYRKALSLNPHLQCLDEACLELKRQLAAGQPDSELLG